MRPNACLHPGFRVSAYIGSDDTRQLTATVLLLISVSVTGSKTREILLNLAIQRRGCFENILLSRSLYDTACDTDDSTLSCSFFGNIQDTGSMRNLAIVSHENVWLRGICECPAKSTWPDVCPGRLDTLSCALLKSSIDAYFDNHI